MRYSGDLTDEKWAFIEPLISPARCEGNKRTVDERQVVNGLMFILSTGVSVAVVAEGPASARHRQSLLLPVEP